MVAKITINGYRSISASTMAIGSEYRIWLHKTPCTESNAVRVLVKSRPACPIRDMDSEDKYVLAVLDDNDNETGEEIILVRNETAPFFPVSPFKGKTGRITPSRVTVLDKVN